MKRNKSAILLAGALAISATIAPAVAQWAVFDAHNYAQNLLEASRLLQQINNQIRSLQNEAMMLQNMGKNLTSLSDNQLVTMIPSLAQVSTLINQAKGIAFTVSGTNAAFSATYPTTYALGTPSATFEADSQRRWQDSMTAFQRSLQIQSQVTQNVQSDSATLTSLVGDSQGAIGNLQALQAGNQLQALAIKQQMQLQNLAAAQDRAVALDRARDAESEEAARSEFATFLGNGTAYK